MSNTNNTKDTFFAFFVGGLIGTIIGLLYSPKSGKETRNNIKKLGCILLGKTNKIGNAIKEQGAKIIQTSCKKNLEKNDI
jgi:gas vesicle protein